MRIAFLTVSAEMGGSERSLVELLRALRRLRPHWSFDVVLPREGPLAVQARDAGASAVLLPMPAALARFGESGGLGARGAALPRAVGAAAGYARALRRLLETLGTDVIHSNGLKHHVLAAWAHTRRMPLIWHIHEYVTPRPLSRTLLRRSAGRVAAAVANSRSVACDLAEAIGGDLRIETIYNGIDLREFSPSPDPADRADLDGLAGWPAAPPDTLRVGLVATFGRWKGHDVFLQALARLDRSLPIRAYIVGGAVYDTAGSQYSLEELRRMTADAGLGDRVAFTGFVPHTAPVLRALDIVVHASTQPEPFGLAIAEAMACGCAVIVSDAGGAAEIVDVGATALAHRPGDAEELARALAALASDTALRRRLGAAARAAALARFDAETFAAGFARVYESVALAPAGAGA
ncbi:MAG TPA: glycosyltransferase [Vicinamibacterales bacterium]|nr:glycosyltransferase [Vicinamibacterales bacterium]